jgi:hypothetical protein
MFLTSLGVNESDLESDFPYMNGESEWNGVRKGVASILTSPIKAATKKSTSLRITRRGNLLLLNPSFVI